MRIHLTGAFEYQDVRVGFGNAAYFIAEQFKSAGFDVSVSKPGDTTAYQADVEMCFDHANRYRFVCPNAYRIGYTPWESTGIPASWVAPMESCDELWTPNKYCRDIFSERFSHKPIFVYQHGISEHYKPRKRKLRNDRPFTFLFIGEPQLRKDGTMVAEEFVKLFGNNPNYRLIIKATHMSNIMMKDPKNKVSGHALVGSPDYFYDNVITYTKMLDPVQMIQLYDEADIFVYPSWGEGWGFNPMQAIAMGIPTISTHVWADYAEYITVPIDSYLFQSPWQETHPGMMFKPDRMQLSHAMSASLENYEQLASMAFKNAFKIHEDYNWEKVSNPAVRRLKKIFSSLDLKV
jgi:glycosyltransferase involved in cell wall biosynthesis